MSLFPYFFREMIRPLRMMENHLRLTEEMFRAMGPTMVQYRRNVPEIESEENPAIHQDKDKFQVRLDLHNFKPEEITVKTKDGNCIEIEGKQERKDESGFVSRQFVRRFVLPKGHELKDVVSSLSSDGMLTVTAPRKVLPEEQERVIPIKHIEEKKEEKALN